MQNRKYFFLGLIILFTSVRSFAQHQWQQQVNYKIEVMLIDSSFELHGFERFIYKNNSPQTLSVIYMHLWPNAYKTNSSPLNQQKLHAADLDFHYAKASQRGYIDSLHFMSNGEVLDFDSMVNGYDDIGLLHLKKPLQPGDSIEISTPFHVRIPDNFSRLGHVDESFQISQWYPKPAVYDESGWHPIHYLDQGEFYSEFGDFEVSISLPKNYVVGATGVLQEQSEIDFLNKLTEDTIQSGQNNLHVQFPASSKVYKTISYKQSHIHDFAWFADKRFYVRKGEVSLPNSDRKITTWAMFTGKQAGLWRNAIDYINRSLQFYSEHVGTYPYDFCTAIDGTISAGGGMEYPMVTCIGSVGSAYELDIVIAHEVGHNWFYGILASNERDNPWMDEGINSFYEAAYAQKYYPGYKLYESLGLNARLANLLDIDGIDNNMQQKIFYSLAANVHTDQANNLRSEAYTYHNYGAMVYGKTVLILAELQRFMGEPAFEMAMHELYDKFAFSHITPQDFKEVFSKYSKRPIDWFFTDYLSSTKKQQVKIKSIKNVSANKASLLIVNKGTTHTPIAVTEYEQAGDSSINWYEMKDKRLKIEEDYSHLKSVSVMNAPDNLNLIDYANTAIVKKSLLKLQHPITVQLIGLLREPNKRQLNILPALGWNNADKSMIGLVFYNSVLSGAKFEYCIAPMFGIGSKRPVGMFKLAYNIYPKWVQSIQFKINGQSFSYHDYYNISKAKTLSNAYYTGSLQAEFQFKNQDANSFIRKTLAVRTVISYQAFESDFHKGTEVYQLYNTNDLKFTWKNVRKINPYNISVLLQQGKNFMTLSSNAKFYISFAKTRGYVLFSLYAGAFLYHQPNEIDLDKGYLPPNSSLTTSSQSAVNNFLSRTNEDFTYDQIYIDRSGSDKILSHQVFTGKEGGFRSMIGNGLGASDKWIMSLSISSKLPKHIPIKPFVTIGTGYLYNTKLGKETAKNFLGEAGFSLVALDNILEIHFPLLITNNIKDNQNFNFGIHKFYERITFTLDLNLFNPLGQLKNIFL